jgi:hypothetical protein
MMQPVTIVIFGGPRTFFMTKELLDSVLSADALAKAALCLGRSSLTQEQWASALVSASPAISNIPGDQVRAVIEASLGADGDLADRICRNDPRGSEDLASTLVFAALEAGGRN